MILFVQLKTSTMKYNRPLGMQHRYAKVQTPIPNIHPHENINLQKKESSANCGKLTDAQF